MRTTITKIICVALALAGCGGGRSATPPGPVDALSSPDQATTVEQLDAPVDRVPDAAADSSGGTSDAPLNAVDSAADAAGSGADLPADDAGSGDVRDADGGTKAGGADGPMEAGPPVDPLCSAADSRGFFGSCAACLKPDDCDQITVGGRTRSACSCSSAACPCGLHCGCTDIAPGVRVCNVCVR
jgi:hypothetical protein